MKAFLFGVYIGLGIIGIFGIIILVYLLAKNNIFITFVKEGTAKAILKYGQFHKIVMSYENHILDSKWDVFKPSDPVRRNIFGGLRWVGIPFIKSVHTYNFKWTSFEQEQEEGKLVQKTIVRKEKIDYILVQDDVYYTFIREAESKGLVPLDIETLLTIGIVNPYKALFKVQDWLETTLNQFKPVLLGYVRQREFEELAKEKEQSEDAVHKLLGDSEIDENLNKDYGVHIKKIGIVNVDPAGERGEKYVEAASKAWEAEKEAARLETIYEKITSKGNEGLFIRAIEGLEKASQGAGNTIVFPLAGAKEMIKLWIGEKEIGEKEQEV